jgi:RNA polymerase sigma-70 factor (ECF subfamily)
VSFAEADALVAAARRGESRAIEELARTTAPEVWRFLAHLVDVESADDLTQETYLRAFGALRRFRGASSLRTWLLSIARRVAADELRRRARRPAALAPPPEVPGEPDVAGEVGARDLLRRLSPDRREAFVLTQIVGLGYAEAAELAGCPVGTIRSRVARARDDLIAMVAERPSRASGRDQARGERPA